MLATKSAITGHLAGIGLPAPFSSSRIGRVVAAGLNANIETVHRSSFAAGIFRKPLGGGTARFHKPNSPATITGIGQSRAPRTHLKLLPAFCPGRRTRAFVSRISPVLRFDLFKCLVR